MKLKYKKCLFKNCKNKFAGSGELPLYCPDHNELNNNNTKEEKIKFCGHYSENFEPCKICNPPPSDLKNWESELQNNERMRVIMEIIGCQKHGADKERYIELWDELWNDDEDVIYNFISHALQEERNQKVEEIKAIDVTGIALLSNESPAMYSLIKEFISKVLDLYKLSEE